MSRIMGKSGVVISITMASLIVIGVAAAAAYLSLRSNEELASKTEWSILQAAEAKYGRSTVSGPIIVTAEEFGERYDLIGLAAKDGRSRVWVLANPKVAPFLKVMPHDTGVTLSKDEYIQIAREVRLGLEVDKFLRDSLLK